MSTLAGQSAFSVIRAFDAHRPPVSTVHPGRQAGESPTTLSLEKSKEQRRTLSSCKTALVQSEARGLLQGGVKGANATNQGRLLQLCAKV